ncbi:hypothetical protein D2962_03910 [Biomaibacter acetigenes]|uniref:S-layer homology domain-containing protein n=1 Tax=Biomaibacter acetigenes TaxID=2316383 RepID=A0A3G2R314_9FIRM|nr:hypothetical protein [Biomaibacter acetigenes]AYO29863.1 hypothetical protein D2962_03910 [Biomaibacter acetigenes]RKL64375.1 hypothetical protein DXT63_01315 [Thermoanaerobacteraceae bacterium SP2]
MQGQWAQKEIERLAGMGIVKGISQITRQEMAAMIARTMAKIGINTFI